MAARAVRLRMMIDRVLLNILVREVAAELAAARKKYPLSEHNILALHKQCGDVTKAVLHLVDRECSPERVYDLHQQCIQLITACVRVIQEGDKSLGVKSTYECSADHGKGRESGCAGEEHSAGSGHPFGLVSLDGSVPGQFY